MLHCSNAHSGAWKGVALHLQDSLYITAPDHIGHGNAPDWDQTRDLHRQATEHASGFLPVGPVDLIGHSFGGTVALRLAIENPERVRSLTLIEPVFFAAARGRPGYQAHIPQFQRFLDLLDADDRTGAAIEFMREWGAGVEWPDIPERQRRYILDRIHLIRAIAPQNYEDKAGLLTGSRLDDLPCPILLMRGADSPPVIADINAALAARTGARDVAIPQAAHMLPITHPDVVARAIRDFLNL